MVELDDFTLNPDTGRPIAFEAALRLGGTQAVKELFALATKATAYGTADVYLLARRGASWTFVLTIPGAAVATDWFADIGPARALYPGTHTIDLNSKHGETVEGLPNE